MKNARYLALGAGVAGLASMLGGGAFAASAMASSSSTAVAVSQAADATSQTAAPDHGADQESYLQALAANLGIDETTLKAALQKTSLAQLQQAVSDGAITEDQADKISAAIQAGDEYVFGLGGGPRLGGPGIGEHGGPDRADDGADDAALAEFLGIDAATLQSDLQSGQSLAAIATNAGKSRDDLKTFLTQQEATELAAAVAGGQLTQAQADQIAAGHAASLDARIDGSGPGPRGPHGGAAAPAPAQPNSSATGS